MAKSHKIKDYCFIPFEFYDTEFYIVQAIKKELIKIYKLIRVEIVDIELNDVYVKFPLESIEVINAIRDLYLDYIGKTITTNSIMKVNKLDCFETFEEAYNACKRLTYDFILR